MESQEKHERWAICASEIDQFESLSSSDRLMATFTETDAEGKPVGNTWQVVVLRNGIVTNQTWDGTVGIPENVRDLVSNEDTLYHPLDDETRFEETSKWINVTVSPDGTFVRMTDEPAPSDLRP